MFWILLFYILYQSSACKPETCLFAEDKAFTKAIPDSVRLQQVLALRAEAVTLLEQQGKNARAAAESLRVITAQHDAGMEQFQEVLTNLDLERERIQGQLLDVRFRMKEHMTEKEWQKVYGKP